MENKKRAELPERANKKPAEALGSQPDTLVWGKNPVTELLKNGAGVDTLLLADSMEPRAGQAGRGGCQAGARRQAAKALRHS